MTQRINVGLEVLSSASKSLYASSSIPMKVSQCAVSSYSFFTNNLNKSERVVQLLLTFMALGQTAFVAVMAFEENDKKCDSLCTAAMISELIYQGLLVSSYAIAEARKSQIRQTQTEDETQENASRI
jgi:ABC-type uncharacterized transport system permease subunit